MPDSPTLAPQRPGERRGWAVEVLLGTVAAVLGALEALARSDSSGPAALVAASPTLVPLVGAIALSRRRPGVAVALLVVGVLGSHVVLGLPLLLAEGAGTLVVYGAARYGRPLTLWLGLLAVPAGAVTLVTYARDQIVELLRALGIIDALQVGPRFALLVLVLGGTIAVLPWLVGVALRARDRAEASRRAAERAELARAETAALERATAARAEAESARADLARDVHDVVGHSLAVILAQAEAAALLAASRGEDPRGIAAKDRAEVDERIRAGLAAIAETARTSLGEVGAVLAGTTAPPPRGGAVAEVLAQTEASGTALRSAVHGTPRPLPPDLDVVAGRVLREMLANALRHGDRTAPVLVTQWWGAELVIEVENHLGTRTPGGGQGLAGMRRRLAAVGGTLFASAVEDRFVAQARLPLSGHPT
ncbi:sensor histidine kinase [Nocardioides sp.]|uniref:sensor histidine kinase n=1 Tax=Nocardioides sp. TaxID=35761 RepID=UPI0035162217